jgi:thymidine phosphorylase
MKMDVQFSDGSQPVGRGIGPALEARDVLAVLRREADAPADLRERALHLAARVLEFSPQVKPGTGALLAAQLLESGKAWTKFLAICEAQGGFREPTIAPLTHTLVSRSTRECVAIDNRRIAQVAQLARRPQSQSAESTCASRPARGLTRRSTIHSEAPGEQIRAGLRQPPSGYPAGRVAMNAVLLDMPGHETLAACARP